MAHAAQKIRFGGVCKGSFLCCAAQVFLIFHIALLLLRNIAEQKHECARLFPVRKAALRHKKQLVPLALHIFHCEAVKSLAL